MKIKKNDNVIVASGKEKGKKGKVLKVFPAKETVIIEGINLSKRRQKARKSGQKGQTLNKAMPVKASAVRVFCGNCNKGARAGYKMIGDKKVRICRKCEKEI